MLDATDVDWHITTKLAVRGEKSRTPCGSYNASGFSTLAWFCVRTGHGYAQHIADVEIRLAGFEVFNPSIWVPATSYRVGRASLPARTVPMFARYLFVQFDRALPAWRRIRSLPGVQGILGDTPDRPSVVPVRVVEALRGMVSPNGCLYPAQTPSQDIPEGAPVRVTSGPLADQAGICRMSDGQRVRLLMRLMGRDVEVTVSRQRVDAA